MNTKPIRDFIIESQQNLEIADAVESTLPDVRKKLADDFLDRLDGRMKANFPKWKFGREYVPFYNRYATYDFWKPDWEGQYGIALQFGDYGKEMAFGVYREIDKIGKRPFCKELISTVQKEFAEAETHEWWEARIRMESPAANWRKPANLWSMYTDNAFLDGVVKQLCELAQISNPIVDRMVRKSKA